MKVQHLLIPQTVQYVAQYPDSTSIRTLETKTQFFRRRFQFSVNEVIRMKAEHFSFKMKFLAIWKLAKQSQKTPFCSGESTFHGSYLRCLLRSKISAAQKRSGNVWYFQRNCFIFKVKILKEVMFSESLLILLEIRFVWNNGGQKHSLSFDVRCPVSGQFFLCCTESMN